MASGTDILCLPPAAAAPGAAPLAPRLAECAAIVVGGAFSEDERGRWLAGVHAARAEWTKDFAGQQFTLGSAWYTHLEQGTTRAYFAGAAAADARVERHAPGLQARLRAVAEVVVGAPVRPRRSFCGPGIHVFPPGAEVARTGGSVHYDLEGLTPAMRAARAPALSLVGMLEAPEAGGGLRLWDDLWDGTPEGEAEDGAGAAPGPPAALVGYAAGDLAVFDSYRCHQIEPFTGARPRVSVTAHLAAGPGGWEMWF
jgi:hypothetical protein